jgi:cytosine/adenosine deaminase-related metal-dependent hydrolase
VAVPHATYTCGGPQIQALAARSGGCVRSIHLEEDPAEAGFHVAGEGPMAALLAERENRPEGAPSGRRPLAWLDQLGVLGASTLLVHLTFADDEAIAIAAARRCIAVLCPRSNAHITGGFPPVDRLRASGVRIALGTDSLASSPSLDVLGELPLLAREGAEPAWLAACATLGGAEALDLPHLGALAPGRRPGLIAVGDDAEGLRDPYAWLCHEGADAPVRRLA